MLQSARGPVPNLAEHIAGEPIRGSWWGHSSGHEIFAVLTRVLDSPDVIATRLVNGKITLIHRRVWPALVRVADRFPAERLASVDEVHTAIGCPPDDRDSLPRVDPRRRPRRRRAAHCRRGARAAACLPSLTIDSLAERAAAHSRLRLSGEAPRTSCSVPLYATSDTDSLPSPSAGATRCASGVARRGSAARLVRTPTLCLFQRAVETRVTALMLLVPSERPTDSPEMTASTGISSARVNRPHPCGPISCMPRALDRHARGGCCDRHDLASQKAVDVTAAVGGRDRDTPWFRALA